MDPYPTCPRRSHCAHSPTPSPRSNTHRLHQPESDRGEARRQSHARRITEKASSRTDFKSAFWLIEHGADPRLEYHGDLAKPPFSMQADSRTIEAIFWIPTEREAAYWQLKCQRWLLLRGYQRPPMPERHRKTRADFGFPTDEKDIPLPAIIKEATP